MQTDDIVAIEQLLYRYYCFALDKGTTDDVAALFHESATLMVLFEGGAPIKGRAQLSVNGSRIYTILCVLPSTTCGIA